MPVSRIAYVLFCLFILGYSSQAKDETSSESSSALSTTPVIKIEITTSTPITSASSLISCPGGHNNPPNCNQCPTSHENINNTCVEIKTPSKPATRSAGHRVVLIFLLCFLSVVGLAAILIVYRRSVQQRRRRGGPVPTSYSNEAVFETNNGDNRFGRILRSFGWNSSYRRGPFNLFSISNNNQSSGQYRPAQTTPGDLHENLDEALLFDDPYADGGLQNSSANPYKSLTLAIT